MKTIRQIILFCFLSFIGPVSIFASGGGGGPLTVSLIYNSPGILCNGGTVYLEEAQSGGTPPYTYKWYNSSGTIISTNLDPGPLPAGVFTLKLYNPTLAGSWDITIPQPNVLSANFTKSTFTGGYNISYTGGHDGTITTYIEGGVPPYTLTWSNGSHATVLTGLSIGTYSVTITDFNGCTYSSSVTLTQPATLLSVAYSRSSHNSFNISCHGGADGSIDLTPSGGVPPYNFDWGSVYTEDRTSLHADTYNVIVDDAIPGAKDTLHIILTEPPALSLALNKSTYSSGFNTSCYNCKDGWINSTVSGGVTPYTYLWSTGKTTPNLDSLLKGNDTLTVTDNNGCKITKPLEITSDNEDWKMGGNLNVDTALQFIGTKDSRDVLLKTNNIKRMTIKASGAVEMNTSFKIFNPCEGQSNLAYRGVYVQQDGTLSIEGCNQINGTAGTSCLPAIASPWYNIPNNSTCPQIYTNDVFLNSDQYRYVGIGTTAPKEKFHLVGTARFGNSTNTTNYLNIVNDGTSKINSYGTGELLINNDSPQNVKINTGTSRGNVITGGNTYLATLSGSVGIGTSSPASNCSLDVNGNVNLLHTGSNNFQIVSGCNPQNRGIRIDNDQTANFDFFIGNHQSGAFKFIVYDASLSSPKNLMSINGDGGVVIGKGNDNDMHLPEGYKLAVNGKIISEEVNVLLRGSWPDFVFNSDYSLRSLKELKKYLENNSHLPDIPTSMEISQTGIPLGEIITKQMQKIEELTLYVLDLQKQIDQLRVKK